MERYVVVDLETTGHSPKYGNEIIEIGLVVIEDRKIVKEYSSKIKPKQKIPSFIKNLTGIDDEAVKDAPTFKEIVPEILPYFEDCIFVAHHVQFDYEFLNEALNKAGYGPIFCPTIDTVELSRIFYPKADGYKLSDLTTYLGIKHLSPHRALSDAYVTGLLFIKILEKIEQLPYEILQQLEPFMYDLQSDFSIIFPSLIEEIRYKYVEHESLTTQNGFTVKKISNFDSNQLQLQDHSFDQFLTRFYEELPLEKRDEQIKMAKLVESTFQKNDLLVIEAGTGIGKTIGYLLPSFYHAFKHHKKVMVSTNTIQLQHQLMDHDSQYIENWLGKPLQMVLLKSPDHYIHLGRLKQYMENFQEHYNYDVVLSLAMILVWLTETETGDKDELQLPSNGEEIWQYISGYDSQVEDVRSSYFNIVLERAKNANLIIVNHSFLLSDYIKLLNRIPSHDYLVIDEAHRFEDVARKQMAMEVDYVSLVHLLNDISKLFPTISIDTVKNMADQYFRSIYQAILFLHSEEDALSETGKVQLTIDDDYLNVLLKGSLLAQLNDFLLSIKGLITEIKQLQTVDKWKMEMLKRFTTQLLLYKQTLENFFDEKESLVRYIEVDQFGAKNAVTIHAEPLKIDKVISGKLIPKSQSIIFTSGTIQTNQSFRTFLTTLGLNDETNCVQIPSAYDYYNQAKIYVPNDFPDVAKTSPNLYGEYVAKFIYDTYHHISKKVFVLMTSYEMLTIVHQQLKRLDEHSEIIILTQGISSSSREKLKKLFIANDHAILIGTNSFWEGFDLNDGQLKTVIMTRLPFDSPNDPLFKAKAKSLKGAKLNVFNHLSLPHAILKFRQAFGRLIRRNNDKGLLFVLDQRIMSKSYGKKFIDAIPEVPVQYSRTEHIIEDAKNWISYTRENDKR